MAEILNEDETIEIESRFLHLTLSDQSPLVGKALNTSGLREEYATLLVAVERGNDNFINITPDMVFEVGDTLWVVSDEKQLAALK